MSLEDALAKVPGDLLGPKRVHVHITGRVQGVFFRDSCKQEADRHHVIGWVRNNPDGSVEALFQGDPSAIEQILAWCHTGPPRARVAEIHTNYLDVETSQESVDPDFGNIKKSSGFQIR